MNLNELAEELKRRYEAAAPESDKMLTLHLFGIEFASELTEDIDSLAQQATGHSNLGSEIRKGKKLAEHVTLSPNTAREGYLAMRHAILPFLKCEECEGSAQLWVIEGGFSHIVCTTCPTIYFMGHSEIGVIEKCLLYLLKVQFFEMVRGIPRRRINSVEEPLEEPTMPVIEGFKVDTEFASVIYEVP